MRKQKKDSGKFFIKDGAGREYRILNQRYNGAVQQIKEYEIQATNNGETRWLQENIVKAICSVKNIPMIADGMIVRRRK